MNDTLRKMKKRLEDLQKGYEKQIADIHAQEGAIQECVYWVSQLENSAKETE